MLDPVLSSLLSDPTTGAWELERRLLAALLERHEHDDGFLNEGLLRELSEATLGRYPNMANLLRLVNTIWQVWEQKLPEASRRELLHAALVDRHASLGHRVATVGTQLLEILGDRRTILTLSRSGTVLLALTFVQRIGRQLRVVIGEGRPRNEGVAAARELLGAGVQTWLVVDSALPAILQGTHAVPLPFPFDPEDTVVVVGADGITPMSLVSRLGNYSLALAARRAEVPVLLLATEDKLLSPELFGLLSIERGAPEELGLDSDLPVLNFLIETVPLELISHCILETGFFTPVQLRERIRSLKVSGYLRGELEARLERA